MLLLLFNERRKREISDVQLLLFYEPLSLTGNLNSCPGHWVWNLVLGEPQIAMKEREKESERENTVFNFTFVRTC